MNKQKQQTHWNTTQDTHTNNKIKEKHMNKQQHKTKTLEQNTGKHHKKQKNKETSHNS